MSPRAKPAPWANVRDVVAVVDGPLAGRWYFATGDRSWAALVTAAELMAPHRTALDPVLDYVVTDELVEHPTEPTVGKAIRYRPKTRPPVYA